ncbi:beta-microseminoprotein isoform X1 [Tupaia chinensis]|uniref:Beta-microseminoprotein n=1 Tax=Tupaia chinensis TaxID=246437 RepID=L8Y9W9_TUPCH|nr:beta-microseminoprotein isoform X1 [Tupaia chinensis]ELV11879.1 Beta-microseminoprotein [Tupaia chinensis]
MLQNVLGSLLVFAAFVTFCNAQCYTIRKEVTPNDLSTGCKDKEGVVHPLKSKWKTENCEQCSCGHYGIHCCNTVPIPVGYDEVKCQKIFNKETCSNTVVERKNPEKTCPVNGWVL